MAFTIKYICLHHFGSVANNPIISTQNLTETQIASGHAQRFDNFFSELNRSPIGYNVIIWPDGTIKQYRYIGEETAACIAYNYNSFHVSMAGNFTKGGPDEPTIPQINSLKKVLQAALSATPEAALLNLGIKVKPGTSLQFAVERIYPHRKLATPGHTICYGDKLPDDYGRILAVSQPTAPAPVTIEMIQDQIALVDRVRLFLMQWKDKLQAGKMGRLILGSTDTRSDEGALPESILEIK